MSEPKTLKDEDLHLRSLGVTHTEYDNVEPTPEALLLCARICHAVTKALNDARGEITLDFGLVKAGLIHAVQDIVEDPKLTGSELHTMWLEDKEAKGWVYGETKDVVKKTHPCVLPYEKLPVEQRVKDDVVIAVVREMFA